MKKGLFFASLLTSLLLVSCGQTESNSSLTSNSDVPSTSQSSSSQSSSSQSSSSQSSSSNEVVGNNIVFTLGENSTEEKHIDPRSAVEGDYELTSGTNKLTLTNTSKVYADAFDAKGNSCIKLGTGSKIATFSFTVSDDITSVVFAIGKYKNYESIIKINDTKYTLTKNSNDGEYDEITIDTTTNKTINFETTLDGKYEGKNYQTNEIEIKSNPRCMINTITLKK